jgi:chaperone modulatory protein CbpM
MASKNDPTVTAILIDEHTRLTLAELSRICAVDERHIVEYVEEGVLHLVEVNSVSWHFDGGALRRARLALRLERDLELNLAGVALALDLMEEIEQLRREVGMRR